MSELAEVLSGAESRTESALPGFDVAVLIRGVAKRARRQRTIRGARTGAIGLAIVAAIGVGGAYGLAAIRDNAPAVPGPVASPSVSAAPSPSASRWDEGRAVTRGQGIPSALPLPPAVLASAGSGWVLAVFDSTLRASGADPIDGQRVLYLISPTGDRYEVANLTQYQSPVLAAWDTDRNVALLVEGRYVALTVDLATGEVSHEWQFCGEGGSLTARPLGRGEWLLRGFCSGSALDGRYADDGTALGADGVVQGGEGVTVMDVGDVQVRYEFEMPPAESYVAYRADGSHVALEPVGPTTACYPLGPSLTGGLAVQCWDSDGAVSIWNLDLGGGAPSPIGLPATVAAIEGAAGGPSPDPTAILTGFCVAGNHEVLTTSHPALAVLGEDGPSVLSDGAFRATACRGGVGDAVLVSGEGPLWTWNARTGATVTLIPVPALAPGSAWVGVSEGGAIIHP
jgi:hypothetical protein